LALSGMLVELDEEIERLKQVRSLLNGGTVTKRGPGRPRVVAPVEKLARKKKRHMTPEGRARIAAAQKARWAKRKKAAGK